MRKMKNNYHKEMMKEIEGLAEKGGRLSKLLLHSCCAPCSSYVILFLSEYFDLEIFFFNPNIHPEEEYEKRLNEQIRLVEEMGLSYKVIETPHQSPLFYQAVKSFENLGEGSERCERCFKLRLGETAKYGAENSFDYFTTTLTISPLKNAQLINKIGQGLEKEYAIKFLCSDFKKNNGYKQSTELSKKYGLYRQNYCGCVFSQQEYKERAGADVK